MTFSGGNASGPEIFPHELGHSLGDLGDEYDYWAFPHDGSTYDGPELPDANLSIYNASQQTAQRTKWFRWLGTESPDGGPVDAVEGGNYTEFGVFRPSQNSLMRSLGEDYNSPSREKMIQSFFASARLVDAASPAAGSTIGSRGTVSVTTLPVPVQIRWYRDGKELPQWRGRTTVNLAKGPQNIRKLAVRVVHATPWVIDPEYRQQYLTQHVTWRVTR